MVGTSANLDDADVVMPGLEFSDGFNFFKGKYIVLGFGIVGISGARWWKVAAEKNWRFCTEMVVVAVGQGKSERAAVNLFWAHD